MTDQAILVVSFGTAYQETYTRTIGRIEADIRETYPKYAHYRAWTSEVIRRKVEVRDGIHIFNVEEAMEQMQKDGIRKVLIQPVYMINGAENKKMKDTVIAVNTNAGGMFDEILISEPLLASRKDCERVVQMIADFGEISSDKVLLFMGHGSEHASDQFYEMLNEELERTGIFFARIGTLQGKLSVAGLLRWAKERRTRRIIMVPFMLTAGEHVLYHMAGDEEISWKRIFEKEGYDVQCVLQGLGEYPEIRAIFLKHLEEAQKDQKKKI